MCGIAGIFNLDRPERVDELTVRNMLGMLRHRGPDEFGVFLNGPVGLGSARLSIIDLSTGQQPISNEDCNLWIVFNGEIFNYPELRTELESRGHRFKTSSDTEVLLHAYEEFGPACLDRLNGQFAFAVWNVRERSLFLARDRLGVRPLFYRVAGGTLHFASEIKAILAGSQTLPSLDLDALGQVFTFWSPLPPRTIFSGITELPPGHYLQAREGKISVNRYWEVCFPASDLGATGDERCYDEAALTEELAGLLVDAARIRLRADVPVGAYLSGGLDSSIIASIIRQFTTSRLDTFSVAFDDTDFDESAWQVQMARFLGTDHQVIHASHADIGRVFPDVIWHTEVPLVRTAPAPMFMLSQLVRNCGYKVVLTGEGADEFLAGYDIFKEAKIRRFWAAQPDSQLRPKLLQRLYPDITGLANNNVSLLAMFFGNGLSQVETPEYSHALRWRNGRRNFRFFSESMRRHLDRQREDSIGDLLPSDFSAWSPLARAQFLEIKIFLSHYLLSSQGDRMAMAHSVEGRFPFLDYRLVAWCNQLPARLKLRGLTEKYLLKKLGRRWLPPGIWRRAKRPYRAPIHKSFFHANTPDYVEQLLSEEGLRAVGLFEPKAVRQLVLKIKQQQPVSESDDMALAGCLSTQLLHHKFLRSFRPARPVSSPERVKVAQC